jgi:hypothetical protein
MNKTPGHAGQRSEWRKEMTSKALLALTAVAEVATGLALIILPALVVRLLLGGQISGAGVGLGRVAGFGLLSLGVACWPRGEGTLAALCGMLTYNLLTTAYFAYMVLRHGIIGKLLLPVLALHALFTLLLIRAWFKQSPEATIP